MPVFVRGWTFRVKHLGSKPSAFVDDSGSSGEKTKGIGRMAVINKAANTLNHARVHDHQISRQFHPQGERMDAFD